MKRSVVILCAAGLLTISTSYGRAPQPAEPNGVDVQALLEGMFDAASMAYLHVHFAKPGCYAARVDRG